MLKIEKGSLSINCSETRERVEKLAIKHFTAATTLPEVVVRGSHRIGVLVPACAEIAHASPAYTWLGEQSRM